MKRVCAIIFVLTLLILSACDSDSGRRLSINSKKFIPYKGHEWLIFKSDQGEKDTIKLSGYEDFYTAVGSVSHYTNYETYRLNCLWPLHNAGDSLKSKKYLISVSVAQTGKTDVSFSYDDWSKYYHFWSNEDLDSIYKRNKEVVQIGSNVIADVVRIRNQELGTSAPTYMSIIYWSMTKGIIGFSLVNGTMWKLEKVISSAAN
ncbi:MULTISPECIES: hypothetical protein [Niastella]|uniref:DUF4377 domain-containing protein n=1 Tax=Niastella soli TaxID=2821487 RepID=A0ABS3YSC3_9BACT|nr:hypothetical protein [Niastella soli]MBO9200797.1 hypothetical protein [Niastella soli]